MAIVDDVFAEYRQLRQNGMSYIDALNEIDERVSALSPDDKDALAQQVRRYEKQLKPRYASAPAPKRPATKPPQAQQDPSPPQKLKKLASSKPQPQPAADEKPKLKRTKTATFPQIEQDAGGWLTCKNCGKKNRDKSTYCYACGHMIGDANAQAATRQFQDDGVNALKSHYFSERSILVLQPRDCQTALKLMPQRETHDMTLGRTTENAAVTPDVDLSPCNADELGVSRLHLALRFDPVDNTLSIYDLGSANGTFVNGQRLNPEEARVLRSEDDLRLGRMTLHVRFMHPSEDTNRLL